MPPHDRAAVVSANRAEPIDSAEARSLLGPAVEGNRVLIAVSGGPDSVALMRLCAAVARRPAGNVHVATVDHGLRAASNGEARQVGIWARECGLDHNILPWRDPKPSTGLQERARIARYRLLFAHARKVGASTLLTAAAVALAGLLGFVGLIVPHLARRVVGPDLRVHGFANLRVADTGIYPDNTMHNTNLTALVVGEMAARLIARGNTAAPLAG